MEKLISVILPVYNSEKCLRKCLQSIQVQKYKEFEVIKYLETIPSFAELKEIINKLGIKPIELIRQKEKIWIENFKGKTMSDEEIIQAMVSNPILIERPIVINQDKAVISRPIEKVASIL